MRSAMYTLIMLLLHTLILCVHTSGELDTSVHTSGESLCTGQVHAAERDSLFAIRHRLLLHAHITSN